jgi:ribosomal protein L37AE/L43A
MTQKLMGWLREGKKCPECGQLKGERYKEVCYCEACETQFDSYFFDEEDLEKTIEEVLGAMA